MIVFLTLAHHAYTVDALVAHPGPPTIRAMSYEALWRASAVPRATYIFTDSERFTGHERRLAGAMRAALLAAGMRCLNDPMRVPTRHGLLLALHRAGINPFRAWRAEDLPRPGRFPVFLRLDNEHGKPISGLIPGQAALDAALAALPARGYPPAGVLVVEYCSEPVAPGVWRRFGTFRVGPTVSCDHAVHEDDWCVKYGTKGLSTEAMTAEEHALVRDNRFAAALLPAFEAVGIEYGRADHTTVEGREVVFEINTNPYVAALKPSARPVRDATLNLSRERMLAALAEIATGDGEPVPIEPGKLVAKWREKSGEAAAFPWRP